MKKLFIISNESIYENNGSFFCDNIDLKSTPEGLKKSFDVCLIARKSKKIRNHQINLKNIKVSYSLFSFLLSVLNSTKISNSKYLLISISPYTFLACFFLRIFKKKPIVYLRSDGFDEYKIILGYIGVIIYKVMFSLTSKISTLISCRNHILKGKSGIVINPSQLNEKWNLNRNKPNLNQINLLYVGRIRKEKGIFSLIDILKKNNDISLTIAGAETNSSIKLDNQNIKLKKIINDQEELIKLYDNHNIFILPSYTEGQPMVLLEALSRLRPTIIFKEIEHVIQNRMGVFVSERNQESLFKTIDHVMKNYEKIQETMKKNHLPTNKEFIMSLKNQIEKQ